MLETSRIISRQLPRFEALTHLLARSASGVPRAITWPQWITAIGIGETEQESHVVLDDDDGELLLEPAHQIGEARGRLGAEAGGRLVEEQDARLGGERHANLERAAVAIGKVLGDLVLLAGESDARQYGGGLVGDA